MDDADVVLIAYGSESRPAFAAVKRAREDGIKAGLLRPITVWPVPEKAIREAASQASVILSVEMNIGKYSGEIERVSCGCCGLVRVTKNRGEIHTPTEIYAAIRKAVT